MKQNDQITNLHRKGVDSAATEGVQNVPASIHRDKRESRAGLGSLRLWLLGIGALAIVLGGTILGRSSRDSKDKVDARAHSHAVALALAFAVTQVSMRNLQFNPVALEVKKGDVVEWKNDDLVPHTATSASFNSGTIVAGQSWRHTFTDVGTFPYVCDFHPQMKGVVIVK